MDLKDARMQLEDEGYCVLADLLDPQETEHIDTLARRTMEPREGYISMETSLNYIPELASLCIHPTLVELAEEMLGKDFILANNVAMKWCKPGAPSGPLHWGGRFKDIPRLTEFQVFWMLTDFTAENGATLAVPFSHHTGRPPGRNAYPQEIPIVGEKGSVLIFDGRIWHRSGANTTTDQHRMAANMMYLPRHCRSRRRVAFGDTRTLRSVPPTVARDARAVRSVDGYAVTCREAPVHLDYARLSGG